MATNNESRLLPPDKMKMACDELIGKLGTDPKLRVEKACRKLGFADPWLHLTNFIDNVFEYIVKEGKKGALSHVLPLVIFYFIHLKIDYIISITKI